jgi:hypothetical protein
VPSLARPILPARLQDAVARAEFSRLDANHDGRLSLDEYRVR